MGVVTRALRPVLPDTVPPALSRLIERCWSRDVAERPAFSELTSTLQRMLEEEREAADGGSLRQPTYSSAMAGPAPPPCTSRALTEQLPAAVHTAGHTTFYDEHVRPSQQRRVAGSSSNILASSLAAEDGNESDSSGCVPLRGLSA